MRRVSMATRGELVGAVGERYARSRIAERGRILDEFVAVTGYHRKHAARLLRRGQPCGRSGTRPGRRIYDAAVREALIVLWEAADRVCGKRLKAVLPVLAEAMERHGHLQLAPAVRERVLAMSAATIDRSLRPIREQAGRKTRRRGGSSNAIRKTIPVRTFSDWHDPPPGFFEADLVAHSGPVASGSFVQTLVLTDIASGWTECAPLLVRERGVLIEVLGEVRKLLPIPLLGFDSDNDSVFINDTVREYCQTTGVVFTRSRPYRKNDQAWVEQKNGAIVRRIVGYRRFEGVEAAAALARLYATTRLFVNFFQPSFKLAEKQRNGAHVIKRYHRPATPYQRLIADPRTPEEGRQQLSVAQNELDPVRLLREMRELQGRLVEIADKPSKHEGSSRPETSLEEFLAGLRTAWKEGEVRPTAKQKVRVRKPRRCPGPFAAVTTELRAWFEAEPWQTGRELLEKLQARHPGVYPSGQLRTLQRRLKIWRHEIAHRLVFGTSPAGAMADDRSAKKADA